MKYRLLFVLGVLAVFAAAAAAAGRVDLVPENAAVVVRVSNAAGFFGGLGESSLGRLWKDPRMQNFLGQPDLEQSLREAMCGGKEGEAQHLQWDEFMMLKGEIVVVLDVEHDEPLLIAHLAAEDYRRSLEMDRRIFELQTDEKTVMTRLPFQGEELVRFTTEHADGTQSVNWQAHVADTLLAAPDREWVEQRIAGLKKEKPAEPQGLPELDVSVRVAALLEEIAKRMDEEAATSPQAAGAGQPPPPSPAKVMEALGLTDIREINFKATLHPDRMVADMRMPVAEPLRGVLSMLDVRPSPADLRVPFVPEGALTYKVSRIDLLALWRAIPGMLSAISPQAQMQFQAVVGGFAGGMGLDIEKDLLAHLDTQYVSYNAMDGDAPVSVTALRLKGETALAGTLGRLFGDTSMLRGMLGEKLKREEFRGFTVYRVEVDPAQPSPAIATGGGYLLYGADNAVRGALRALAAPQAADQAFYRSPLAADMRRMVPPRAFGYNAVDWPTFVRGALTEATKQKIAQALQQALAVGQADEDDEVAAFITKLDWSKLPPGSHIASFLGPSFSFAELVNGVLRLSAVLHYQSPR